MPTFSRVTLLLPIFPPSTIRFDSFQTKNEYWSRMVDVSALYPYDYLVRILSKFFSLAFFASFCE